MKKILLTAMVFLLMAAPAWAATYPVYVDDNEIGQAQIKNGQTFLPMRAIFEACGATVHWDSRYQVVSAKDANNRAVRLRVGSRSMSVHHDGLGEHCEELPAAPYHKNGRVYVPVRAVGEAMGCNVQWLPAEKRVSVQSRVTRGITGCALDIKPKTGEIMLAGKVLAQVPLQLEANTMDSFGEKTAAGNYLLTLGDWVSGAVTVNRHQYIWLNPQNGEYVTATENAWLYSRVGVLKSGNADVGEKYCMCGDDVAYVIDDKAGQVIGKYDLRTLAGDSVDEDSELRAVWFDDDYMLVRDLQAVYWGLLDFSTGTMRDITDRILPAEVKAKVNTELWPLVKDYKIKENFADDEEYLAEWFYSDLRHSAAKLDAHLSLEFKGIENDELKFEMVIWGENFVRADTVEIGCTYK